MRDFLNDISMDDIFMMFAILFGLFFLSLVFFFVAKGKRDAEDRTHPEKREKARVIEKEPLPPGTILSISEQHIMFETENGERLRLIAKADNKLMAGDEGYLTWQGRKVINFVREN